MIKIITDITDFTEEYNSIKEELLQDIVNEMEKCKEKRNYLGLILSIILFVLIEVIAYLLLCPLLKEHLLWLIFILFVVAPFAIRPMTLFLFEEPEDKWKDLSELYVKYKKEIDVFVTLGSLTYQTELESKAKRKYIALRNIEKLKDTKLTKLYIENNKLVVNDVVFTDFSITYETFNISTISLYYRNNKVEAVCH